MHSDGEALTMMRQEEVPPLLDRQRQLGRLARVLDDEDLSRSAQLEHKEPERREQHGEREDEQNDHLAGGINHFTQRLQVRLRLQPERAEEGGDEGDAREILRRYKEGAREMVRRSHLQPEQAEEDGHEGQGRDECHKVVT